MIILDIETTGLTDEYGICEIGAIDFNNPSNFFVQDCRIDDSDKISKGALAVNGRTFKELFDNSKQSQKELISNYLNWVEKQPLKLFYGQNVSWDITMIQSKCLKYGLEELFLDIHVQRGMDLHTIAQEKYFDVYGKYFLKKTGQSAFNLGKVLEFSGLNDNRVNVKGNSVVKEGNYHGALEDCKLEGEALSRIKYGKGLFEEFKKFKIPDYLKK